ncbi:hypothetical protein [Pseudomonas poae]|uniref:hypothetical protein n=1 Tax=Pseudomonas poae TaxID=200451 RepID=UPI0034D79D31
MMDEDGSSKHGKFTAHEVAADDVLDFNKWQCMFYKKLCVSKETRGENVRKEYKAYFQIEYSKGM